MKSVGLTLDDLPRYTYDEYYQWEGKWELIRGVPVSKLPTPGLKHQRICGRILGAFCNELEGCPGADVLPTFDWQIYEDTVVSPDGLIAFDDEFGDAKLEVTPALVVEILSKHTEKLDKGIKFRIYEAGGVKYYCIVDPVAEAVAVFVLNEGKYREVQSQEGEDMIFDFEKRRIKIDFRDFFKYNK